MEVYSGKCSVVFHCSERFPSDEEFCALFQKCNGELYMR